MQSLTGLINEQVAYFRMRSEDLQREADKALLAALRARLGNSGRSRMLLANLERLFAEFMP